MEEKLKIDVVKVGVGKISINESAAKNFYFIHNKNYPSVKTHVKTIFTKENISRIGGFNSFGPYREIPKDVFNRIHDINMKDKTRECFNMIYGIILTYPVKQYQK